MSSYSTFTTLYVIYVVGGIIATIIGLGVAVYYIRRMQQQRQLLEQSVMNSSYSQPPGNVVIVPAGAAVYAGPGTLQQPYYPPPQPMPTYMPQQQQAQAVPVYQPQAYLLEKDAQNATVFAEPLPPAAGNGGR
ncbi:hypothetical protein HK101_007597 [Irineochytrium annulatum]|nr:hypothetical protein HK101_007597 [Irineochytrium annulatum]